MSRIVCIFHLSVFLLFFSSQGAAWATDCNLSATEREQGDFWGGVRGRHRGAAPTLLHLRALSCHRCSLAHYNRLFLKTTKKLLQYTKWTFLQYSTWLDSALPIFWFIVFYCLDFVVLTTCHPHEGKTKLDWINSHTEQVNIWMNPKRN